MHPVLQYLNHYYLSSTFRSLNISQTSTVKLTCFEWNLVPEPLDLHSRISYRYKPALKVSCLSFRYGINILQRLSEDRSLPSLRFWYVGSLPRLLGLQFTDFVHSFRSLGVQNDIFPWDDSELDGRDTLAKGVDSFDGIFSSVFRNRMADVKGHVPEVEGHVESRSRWQRFAIVEELDS